MLKAFAKFNGYTVAVACINYSLTRVLESNLEGKILQNFSWLKSFLATEQQPTTIVYMGLLIASITMFLGIFWECKVLVIPFVIAYTIVLNEETGGTYRMAKLWEVLFTLYAALTVAMLMLVGICSCCRSHKSGRDGSKHSSMDELDGHHRGDWIRGSKRSIKSSKSSGSGSSSSSYCWSFWCCRCCHRRRSSSVGPQLDSHSHCSCETLNIRPAGPNDKHYHRVIFV